MHRTKLKLTGIQCPACTKLAARILNRTEDVENVRVELDGDAHIESKEPLNIEFLIEGLNGSEYGLANIYEENL